MGCISTLKVMIDSEDGPEIGRGEIGLNDGTYRIDVKAVTGRHALYFVTEMEIQGWTNQYFEDKMLFELESFVFLK